MQNLPMDIYLLLYYYRLRRKEGKQRQVYFCDPFGFTLISFFVRNDDTKIHKSHEIVRFVIEN